MYILKRSLLITLFVWAIFLVGSPVAAQSASPADSALRVLQAHPTRDSNRVTLLLQLADAIVYTDPGTAMHHADEALEIADSLRWTKGIALAQRQKGNVYYVFSDNT